LLAGYFDVNAGLYRFAATELVLEWLVLDMFVPSLCTGSPIKRFGASPVMGVGVRLNLICVGIALMHFLAAVLLPGLTALALLWLPRQPRQSAQPA
jgi:hypothetical protein